MRITVAPDRCVGAGQCVLNAPALFDQDDDGLVTLLADPGADQESAARVASGLCPSRAITVHEG
ncbi:MULTISPECIES: ferredoxin [Streptomyces]|uniref:Ferredoxin-1 n=2 Tax=Streptomyces TaxID=1883 RepID=A0A2N8PG47_STRNR|nr:MULTISPECIES: ferredoxin [Streptomyces]PNE39998.1 ferredoxin-1 [Streptomyces noursei]QRX89540.1 ferredoxin [Streptomyces noursei]UJB39562.1 ferredoxin [Streptomyces sp. A1-5]SHM78873.1 Ferredoxin [Streptomyces yunnanensis]